MDSAAAAPGMQRLPPMRGEVKKSIGKEIVCLISRACSCCGAGKVNPIHCRNPGPNPGGNSSNAK